ncbi:MAG: type II toxin-antitoxin system Phd/YefM family antitoxin [Methanomassiliicoccaceae archaeon]|nr:type II toxin-antitoxin system Phd/YefM family antitoxin [Methanomassiliicoccaceae archaeon]
MMSLSVTDARRDIFNIMRTVQNSDAVTITSKDGNAVLVSENEWNGIKETLYLLSIPGMLESILGSSAENISEMVKWEDIRDTL